MPLFAATRAWAVRTPTAPKQCETRMQEEWSRCGHVRPRPCLPSPPPPDHGHRWTLTCFPAPNVALPPCKSNHCSIIGWPTVSMSRFCGWTLKAPTIGWAMRTAIGCTPLFHFITPIRSRLINIAQAWYAQLFDACASMKLNFGVYGATRFQYYVYTYMYVCLYVCMYVCILSAVCMYVCIHVCMYTCTRTFIFYTASLSQWSEIFGSSSFSHGAPVPLWYAHYDVSSSPAPLRVMRYFLALLCVTVTLRY